MFDIEKGICEMARRSKKMPSWIVCVQRGILDRPFCWLVIALSPSGVVKGAKDRETGLIGIPFTQNIGEIRPLGSGQGVLLKKEEDVEHPVRPDVLVKSRLALCGPTA